MNSDQQNNKSGEINKKEQRDLRRQERQSGQQSARASAKRALATVAVVAAAWGGIWGLGYLIKSAPAIEEGDIISRNGMHWHAELKIAVKGKEQEIPAGVGLGAVHNPLHTHDPDGVIHMEFGGVVLKNDVRLGKFFEVWGKKFDRNCVFEFCNGSEGTVKMLVNGQSSEEFENYMMKDGDKIEIRYE